jgi:predicted nucleotidyltransferase
MADVGGGRLGCYRCAYVWRSRFAVRPRMCPRCKSRQWDVPVLRAIGVGKGPGIEEILGPHRNGVQELADRFGFEDVRVFGSVRRRQAKPGSDVDLLVHARRGTSLLDHAAFELELERLLGCKVDVVPDGALHWSARPQILFEAVPL